MNRLRNLAQNFVFTGFVYLADVDFMPDKKLYDKARAAAAKYGQTKKASKFTHVIQGTSVV